MSQSKKEPSQSFALRFCSMGCNDDQSQTEISGNQVGSLAMLPKQNEKQSKKQQNLNDSQESDILEGISEKGDNTFDKKELIQPSLTQKNTLSSLKQGGSLLSTNRSPFKVGNDTFKHQTSKSDFFQKEVSPLHGLEKKYSNNDTSSKPIARVLGYGGSENAISDDEEMVQQYQFQNGNMHPQYRAEKEKRSGLPENTNGNQYYPNNTIPYNNNNNNNNNHILVNEYSSSQDHHQPDNLESTERFNAQPGSNNNIMYQNQKEIQQNFNQQGDPYKNGEDNQGISPRFTEETAVYNNAAMQKFLQQKVLQDRLLISQLKSSNLSNNYGQNSPHAQFQSIQNQLGNSSSSHKMYPDSNPNRMMPDSQSNRGQGIQDHYSQMMNGVCISKASLPSHHDYNAYDNHQSEIPDSSNQMPLNNGQNDLETFYPTSNVQVSSNYNSSNPNNYEINHPHHNQTNNLNVVIQQKQNNQMNGINSANSFGAPEKPYQQNSHEEDQQQWRQDQHPQGHQQQNDYYQQPKNIQYNPLGVQQYQIPKGYEVIHGNGYPIEKMSYYSDTNQIKQVNGDRPLTVDSSRGTEYTTASQKNLGSARGGNQQNQPSRNSSIPSIKATNSSEPINNYLQNPLNVYLMQHQPPNIIQTQNSNNRDYDHSEDIKCNYSQSINEIHPQDMEQQQKHYLHQHNLMKKRDLVSDSHLFNSFNNTNFFQNQTIPNNSNSNLLINSNLNMSNAPLANNQQKNQLNRIVNLSSNSEVHEYTKSKTPLNEPGVNQSNNTFTSHVLNGQVPLNQSIQPQIQNDGDVKAPRDSMNSSQTNQASSINYNVDMSHIMQKVNDIQGKTKDQQLNQVMLNSLNTQPNNIPSVNNFNSLNQYSSVNNQTGNFDTARTISQVYLNSHHFYDAGGSNMQFNQVNTLTSSIDGRKKSESNLTPKHLKNGMMSSNPNLQTQYTFKQLDTPDASGRDQHSLQQHQIQLMNSNQYPIKETDRALEQSELDGTLSNQHNFGMSPSPTNGRSERQERELQQINEILSNNLRKETEDGLIPDDEYNRQIQKGSIEIDPVYKLSPKAKSQTSLSNNQIYNENAQKNLISSIQYMSNQSSNPALQSFQQFQYQSNGNGASNFYKDTSQYSSQNSNQTSPFNKLSLHLDRIEQVQQSPHNIDPSPKYTDVNSISQFSPRANANAREEKVKQSLKQSIQNQKDANEDKQQLFERQKIEAALMNNDDETEDNQKLIRYIYESGLMKKHLSPIPQESSSKYQNFSPDASHQEMLQEEGDNIDPEIHQNTLQSNGYHQNAQYVNGKFSNSDPNQMMKPSIQFENTPNFNSSIGSNNPNTNNKNYPLMSSASSQQSIQKDQQNSVSIQKYLQDSRQISLPTSHNNHPYNQQQNIKLQPQATQNTINSLNNYFINPDYSKENPKMGQHQNNIIDPMKNLSQASSIRVHKVSQQPNRLTDNSRNPNEWSQNNDGTIMFTRDGQEFLPQESINENILFLNSSKALRDKNSPSPSRITENTFTKNQLFEPIATHGNKPVEINMGRDSPNQERRSRSPSPITVKMTRAAELKQKASQERIKQMNDKIQKKKDLVNLRLLEFEQRQEEKEMRQDNVVKEQNKQLRIQNLRLKEQNELLKKQMENTLTTNQYGSSVQSGASGTNPVQVYKQNETAVSGRQNSTPHKNSHKSPPKTAFFSTKMRSPSLHSLHNNQSHHNINKNNISNNLGNQGSYPVVSISMNISNNQSNPNLKNGYKNEPQLYPLNQNPNQQGQHTRDTSPNNNMCKIDISNILNQAKQVQQDVSPHEHSSIGSQNIKSNNPSRKTSMSDILSQDHPKLNYSPKNFNSIIDHHNHASSNSHRSQHLQNANNYYVDGSLTNNPSAKSINSNLNYHMSEQGSPANSQKYSTQNLQQMGNQVQASFQRVPQQNKLYESSANNSIGESNHINTKDTFQQSSPENQLKGHHFRSASSTAHNQTKSSIASKPQNQLYDSKNSMGYENLQIHMSDQYSVKPSLNDISGRSPDSLNKKLDFSSTKKAINNNMNNSTKESLNGQITSNQSRNPQSGSSPINARKNDFMPKQIPQQNNQNKNEFLMSAHLENQKKNNTSDISKNNKSYGIRDQVEQEMNKADMNNKYKLVQNMDNTYLLMQKNTKSQPKNSINELSKNSFKNNFMPRQYNPDEIKNKSQTNNISQENSYDQAGNSQQDIRNSQQKSDNKAPLKLVLVPNQQQQQNQIASNKSQIESHRSKQGDSSNKNVLEKKHSTPSLTLPKTNSNLSIGMKSNRSQLPINQAEISGNFINQNTSSISNGHNSSKNGYTTNNNQLNKAPSQSHIRSQSNVIPSQTANQTQNNNAPETNKMINNAMNSIFQKIENCYDNISAGYDKSVNVMKKENK